MHRHYLIQTILLGLLALSISAETRVTAIFNPPRIATGDQSQYVVEIQETSTEKQPRADPVTSLPISQSPGLTLTNGRISNANRTTITKGKAEYSATQQLIIDTTAPRAGSFTIPSYTFQYKGETIRAPAATLQVVERSADAGATTDELIFLKSDAPDQLYVGQTTPILLKLYLSEGVSLTGLNSFDRTADGFTVSELPDSRQSREFYQGRQYIVYTWPLTVTPIQAGEQDLNFQFTVSAQVPEQNNRRDLFGGRGFGSSVFDNFFGRSERFTVYTEPTTVDVQSLPTYDQPESFTGAIGDFAMQVYTDRKSTQAGEPIMLSVEISGQGNFDRINGPVIPETDQWRSYEPESKFEPRVAGNSLRGAKRFDYVMIPNQAGKLKIPEFAFAYFEPKTKRYAELTAPSIEIEVSPSNTPPAQVAPNIAAPIIGNDMLPQQKELSIEEALLTLDYRPKDASGANGNLLNWSFWLVNAAAAFALIAICYCLRNRRRLAEDPAYAGQHAAKLDRTTAIKAARRANGSESFYHNAQNAIRLAVTYRAQRSFRSANINELTDYMTEQALPTEVIEQTRQLFATADALRFSGTEQSADLSTAKSQLERVLKAI